MTVLFPIRAATIEAIMHNIHPVQTKIHMEVLQKLGSPMAEKIKIALMINGTYQMLLGFSLTMKKQLRALNTP